MIKRQWFQLDEAKLAALIRKLLLKLPDQAVCIFLEGDLGAGKTRFCQLFLAEMGFDGRVKSPTYSLVEPYTVNQRQLYHMDLYRLSDPEELEYLGIRDLGQKDDILLIEWPSKGHGMVPDATLKLLMQHHTDRTRHLTIQTNNVVGQNWLQQI